MCRRHVAVGWVSIRPSLQCSSHPARCTPSWQCFCHSNVAASTRRGCMWMEAPLPEPYPCVHPCTASQLLHLQRETRSRLLRGGSPPTAPAFGADETSKRAQRGVRDGGGVMTAVFPGCSTQRGVPAPPGTRTMRVRRVERSGLWRLGARLRREAAARGLRASLELTRGAAAAAGWGSRWVSRSWTRRHTQLRPPSAPSTSHARMRESTAPGSLFKPESRRFTPRAGCAPT